MFAKITRGAKSRFQRNVTRFFPLNVPTFVLIPLVFVLSACQNQPDTLSKDRAKPAETALASTTLCADSYLLAVAPEQITALSWQAGSDLSTVTEAARNLPRLSDSREAIFGVKANLITGPASRIKGDLDLVWGEDFSTLAHNLEQLQSMTDADVSPVLSALTATENLPHPQRKPRILYLSRSGGSAGPGTFVDAVIKRAGGINAATAAGWHTPSVEALITTDADIILTSFFSSNYHGVSDRAIRHKALRDYIDAHPRIDVPGRLWPCAGPGLIEATSRINSAILEWADTP
jgi:iron complex transport system substrate-binding protein